MIELLKCVFEDLSEELTELRRELLRERRILKRPTEDVDVSLTNRFDCSVPDREESKCECARESVSFQLTAFLLDQSGCASQLAQPAIGKGIHQSLFDYLIRW